MLILKKTADEEHPQKQKCRKAEKQRGKSPNKGGIT